MGHLWCGSCPLSLGSVQSRDPLPCSMSSQVPPSARGRGAGGGPLFFFFDSSKQPVPGTTLLQGNLQHTPAPRHSLQPLTRTAQCCPSLRSNCWLFFFFYLPLALNRCAYIKKKKRRGTHVGPAQFMDQRFICRWDAVFFPHSDTLLPQITKQARLRE